MMVCLTLAIDQGNAQYAGSVSGIYLTAQNRKDQATPIHETEIQKLYLMK
jgi:hypothetical protein